MEFAAPPGYTIGLMRRDEFERCLDINAEAFVTSNPLVRHLGIPAAAWRELVKVRTSGPSRRVAKHLLAQ